MRIRLLELLAQLLAMAQGWFSAAGPEGGIVDDPQLAVIAGCCLAGIAMLAPLASVLRRVYWSDWVQDLVMRWTGESRLVMTAWGPSIAPRRPPVRCTRGALAGDLSTGMCRSLARASPPAAASLPGASAAGSTVRLDAPPSPVAHPSVGADTPLAATAGEDLDWPVVAADHQAESP